MSPSASKEDQGTGETERGLRVESRGWAWAWETGHSCSGDAEEPRDGGPGVPEVPNRELAEEPAGIAKRQTASEYLQQLEGIGVLTGERRGREIIYKHPALVEVLTA